MKPPNRFKRQQGAALIVSLIILIAMTLLGITSMRGTTTELAMAGNLRESSLAFQAAEAGLRSAEIIVADSISSSSIANQVDQDTAEPDYFDASSWTGADDADIDLSSVGVTSPQYIIKYVGENSGDRLGLLNTGGGYNAAAETPPVAIYRVTARASGLTRTTFRTVQSHYGKIY
ncbi:MAG: hypothetical protein GY820_17590 [Gammaproteobacteria bacterium]|nr:hypothetical protein [Gammaproteobacteria bacterium]